MGERTAAGWYLDPDGLHERRFWDGTAWRDWVADGDRTWSDPPQGEHPPPRPDELGNSLSVAPPVAAVTPTAAPARRYWLADAVLLIVVAVLVGAGTALVLKALDDDGDTVSTSQLEA